MARAAIAAGADGLMVEVHPKPEEALSDGVQSLTPPRFADLMRQLEPVASALGRNQKPITPHHSATSEVVLPVCLYGHEAPVCILVPMGFLSNEEVLEKVKVVRRE